MAANGRGIGGVKQAPQDRQVMLLIVCCLWLAWGFNTAVVGILSARARRRRTAGPFAPSASRTAILMPVYNEDADAVLARVAAMIEGEATVKTFKRKEGKVWLMPHNPAFSPIDGDHATILGKVTAVLRRL